MAYGTFLKDRAWMRPAATFSAAAIAVCMAAAPAGPAHCAEQGGIGGAGCSVVVTDDGISLDTDDMFRFSGMLPGDSCEGSVRISNTTGLPYRVTLSADAPEVSEGSTALLDATTFELRSDEGMLSHGPLSSIGGEDYVFDLGAGETKDVSYNARLSESAGIEVASSAARVQWTWSAAPEKEASLAKTGDALGTAAAVAFAAAAASGVATGISALRARRRKGGTYAS